MNKKIFASAIFAMAAFVSTYASAAVTYTNSVADPGYAQTANAVVGAGGGSVRGNDLIIGSGANGNIPADAEIIVRLPAGLNFDGAPSYLVSPATPTQGLTLKDGTEFQDPTLNDPGITMFDTDGDGGMDRALVTVGAASGTGDTLTISVNIKASSTATAGVKKASLIVNNGLAVVQNVAEVVATLAEPVQSVGTLTTHDQSAATDVGTLTATFIVTVPKGTAGGKTVTFAPQSKLKFATSGSTLTYTLLTPRTTMPFTAASLAAANGTTATTSISLTVTGTSTVTLSDDVQVKVTISQVDLEAGGSIGARGVTIGGTAGLVGTASLVDVKANGASAAITTTTPAQKIPNIVIGSTAPQTLPTVTITENFDGDAATAGGSDTITITPGAGLVFDGSLLSPTITGMTGTATVSAGTLTIVVTTNSLAATSLTINNLQARAASTATAGALTIKVGTPDKNNNYKYTVPGTVLTVGSAVSVGTVSVTGPTTLKNTGPGSATVTNTVTLKESTYGAITKSAETQVQQAYVRVTPTSNGTITAVAITPAAYPVGATTPTFNACVAETGVTDGSYICIVSAESTGVTAGTSTVSVAVDIKAKSTAAIGSTLDVTLSGNSGISGTATLANVGVATTASKGAVPDLTPGDTEAANLATLTITENFTGAVSNANKAFRLVAPSGVAFQDAASVQAQSSVGTATITATFSPNDTLIIYPATTATITVTPKAVLADSVTGWLSFNIINGDIDGNNGAGVTNEAVMLAYADGTLTTLDAGADATVTTGFTSSQAVSGGLVAYKTPTTSDASIATATMSGSTLVVKGVGVGIATITVADQLGGSDSIQVTVSAGATQPTAPKQNAIGGDAGDASFTAGASTDGGASYATEFTTADDVTLVTTINVSTADQGSNGELHVALLYVDADGNSSLSYLNDMGTFSDWDQTIEGLGAAEVVEPLAASHTVSIYSGNLGVGTYRFAVAYSTSTGKLVFTPKAMIITVTE